MSESAKPDPISFGSTKTVLFAGSEGLRQMVSLSLRETGCRILFATGGEEALRRALEFEGEIHVLLANVEMPDMTGIELAQRLNQKRPAVRTFLLSSFVSGVLMLDHSWQFLPTPFESELLRTRIRDILSEPTPLARGQLASLTKRELQTLKLIAEGNSTKQIAGILGIAFKTSVGHRARLMKKLGIHDTASLVRYAIRIGLSEA